MLSWIFVIACVGIVGLVAIPRRSASLAGSLSLAQKTSSAQPLIAFISTRPASEHETLWDQALGRLWQSYQRELVAQILFEIAPKQEVDILQYWIKQVFEVEPEIAQEHFNADFLATAYRPELAACYGRCGGCK